MSNELGTALALSMLAQKMRTGSLNNALIEGLIQQLQSIQVIEQLLALLETHLWKRIPPTEPGMAGMASLLLDRQESDVIVLLAMEHGAAPKHRHPQGEQVLGLRGQLYDVMLDGGPALLPGRMVELPPASVHQPYTLGLWVGVYRQPAGFELVLE